METTTCRAHGQINVLMFVHCWYGFKTKCNTFFLLPSIEWPQLFDYFVATEGCIMPKNKFLLESRHKVSRVQVTAVCGGSSLHSFMILGRTENCQHWVQHLCMICTNCQSWPHSVIVYAPSTHYFKVQLKGLSA